MSQEITDLLNRGREACEQDSFRVGNTIALPRQADLIATGDIHGHSRNLERIITYSDLANNPDRHVMLHEIIHGGDKDALGGCLSYMMLFEAIKYKLDFPDQVHLIMGNHDTTFINNSSVMKNGREMNVAFRQALDRHYGGDSKEIKLAMRQFLFAQPLAIKCPNGIWLSHSLPADNFAPDFDYGIFKRSLKINDVVKPGAAYVLTWGRRMSQRSLDAFAEKVGVKIFVLGHQPQSQGYCKANRNLIILASDHNHGCLLPIDLSRDYTTDELVRDIVPLASIA